MAKLCLKRGGRSLNSLPPKWRNSTRHHMTRKNSRPPKKKNTLVNTGKPPKTRGEKQQFNAVVTSPFTLIHSDNPRENRIVAYGRCAIFTETGSVTYSVRIEREKPALRAINLKKSDRIVLIDARHISRHKNNRNGKIHAVSFLPVEDEQPYPTKKFSVSSIQHLVEDAPKPWEPRARYRKNYWGVFLDCHPASSAKALEPDMVLKTWVYSKSWSWFIVTRSSSQWINTPKTQHLND